MVTPPKDAPSVLCICTDDLLRTTRQLVLSTRYQAKSIASPAEMADIAGEHFDVVILCHTLTGPQCERALQLSHLYWPAAEVILLARAGDAACLRKGELVLRPMHGPESLLSGIDRSLDTHCRLAAKSL